MPKDETAGAMGMTGDPNAASAWKNRTVYERMVEIISEVPAIGKTQRNEQQKFMFRGHDDVMNALNPLLARHGVFVVPNVIERVVGERTTGNNKTMYEVNLHVEFTFYGLAGDSFTASGWGEGTDMGDKSTSKAMTMAFKYVVAQAFALATAETSDADAASPEETTRGGGSRQREQRSGKPAAFDPGRSLIEQAVAVKNEQDASFVTAAVEGLFGQETDVLLQQASQAVFGAGRMHPETQAEWGEWWIRLANFIVKADAGAFPPPPHKDVQKAWAWAFKGDVLADAAGGAASFDPADPAPESPETTDAPEKPAQDAVEGSS